MVGTVDPEACFFALQSHTQYCAPFTSVMYVINVFLPKLMTYLVQFDKISQKTVK